MQIFTSYYHKAEALMLPTDGKLVHFLTKCIVQSQSYEHFLHAGLNSFKIDK